MIISVKKWYLEYLGVSWELGSSGEVLCTDVLNAGLSLLHDFGYVSCSCLILHIH